MSNKRVIGVLKRARALVAKGWTQGPMSRRVGRKTLYCAWGGVSYATKSNDSEAAAIRALGNDPTVKAFHTRRGTLPFGYLDRIVSFNEAPGRKQSQIVALFDRTIARLERQAS